MNSALLLGNYLLGINGNFKSQMRDVYIVDLLKLHASTQCYDL